MKLEVPILFGAKSHPSKQNTDLPFFDLEQFISLTFKSTDGTFYMKMRLEATRHQKRHTVRVKNFHLNTREVCLRKLQSSHLFSSFFNEKMQ